MQDNKHTRNSQNMLHSNYLVPTILEPTRVANVIRNGENHTTETLIDNIIINRITDFRSGLIYSSISDHCPVFTTLTNCNPQTQDNAPKYIKTRLIDDFRIRKFKSALQISLLNSFDNINDAQSAFSQFFTNFNLLYWSRKL